MYFEVGLLVIRRIILRVLVLLKNILLVSVLITFPGVVFNAWARAQARFIPTLGSTFFVAVAFLGDFYATPTSVPSEISKRSFEICASCHIFSSW